MTHTQGPWRVTGNSIRSDNHIDGTGALLLAAGPMFHDYTPDPEEQTANLKLAAAAPAMLKALQELMRTGLSAASYQRTAWAQAEAAIAEATDETIEEMRGWLAVEVKS
jgi:hypothetical protein